MPGAEGSDEVGEEGGADVAETGMMIIIIATVLATVSY